MSKFLNNVNLVQNELQNAVIHPLAAAPSNPVDGQMYYDTSTGYVYHWHVDHWVLDSGLKWRFGYDNTVQYYVNDVVFYGTSSYVATVKPPVGTLPTNDTYWDILAVATAGEVTYQNPAATTQTVGGIPAGSTFPDARTVKQMFDQLLYPYQVPSFSSFSMTGQSQTVEVGTQVSGSKTFTWASSNASNVQPGSVQIYQGATLLASGLNASGSTTATITPVNFSTPTTATWTIRGTNTNGQAMTIASFTVTSQFAIYYGISNNNVLDNAGVLGLTGKIVASSTSPARTYSYPSTQYKYLAVPNSFTTVASIKDANTLLAVAMASSNDNGFYSQGTTVPYGTMTVTNSLGVSTSYKVYRSRYVLGDALNFVVA